MAVKQRITFGFIFLPKNGDEKEATISSGIAMRTKMLNRSFPECKAYNPLQIEEMLLLNFC